MGTTTPRLTKACFRCHSRKVKCDALVVGLPCTRCVTAGFSASCAQMTRQPRRKKPAKTHVPHPPPTPSEAIQPVLVRDENVQVSLPPLPDRPSEQPLSDGLCTTPSRPGDVPEYWSGLNYLSILADVVGREQRQDLTRLVSGFQRERTGVSTPSNYLRQGAADMSGLDDDSQAFLVKKGVFDFPPREHMDILLRCFFEFVYPSAPVFDRVEFMQAYDAGQGSAFIMQAILSIAALYAPMDTLVACGFNDRSAAQVSFYHKANLLYDFGCETAVLPMLQGSFILSSTVLPFSLDKDFRYWFMNALRLAVKMGLHRNDCDHGMDKRTRNLCRRIWCAIYSRDLLLAFHGHQNIRMLTNKACDTTPLKSEEWEDEVIPAKFESFLPPVNRQQKLRFSENYKLSIIASTCLSDLQRQKEKCPEDWVCPFDLWRENLPDTLRPQQQSSRDEIWYTVLLATSYRFEATIFRLLRNWYQGKDSQRLAWAKRRLRGALFELDTLLARVVAKDMLHKYPLLFKSYVPVVLALYIEVAIDGEESELTQSMARVQIRQGMVLLRQLQDFPMFQLTLRAFEWLLVQKNLIPAIELPEISTALPPMDPAGPRYHADFDPADILQESDPWFHESLGFGFLETADLATF